jgi:hypothetical protein
MSNVNGEDLTPELIRDATVRARIPWFSSSHAESDGDGRIYTVGTRAQWTEDDIDWASGRPLAELAPGPAKASATGGARALLADRQAWPAYQVAMQNWAMSQLVFGEQGALVVTGRLVEALPDMTSKCVAAVQVFDEARHVRVLQRYLEVSGQSFVPEGEITTLLGGLLEAPDWDYLLLGMQVVLEGVALSIFRSGNALFRDPLLADICERIARDEARHYTFGVVSLGDHLASLTTAERRDRQDYLAGAVQVMAGRFRFDSVWDQLGIPRAQGHRHAASDPDLVGMRRIVFRPVVRALQRIGLWDGLEETFQRMDLIAR